MYDNQIFYTSFLELISLSLSVLPASDAASNLLEPT